MVTPSTSASNLTQKTFLNAASSLLSYGIVMLVGLVLNPILVTSLGVGLFGAWKICLRLLSYVSAADGQANQALKWTIASRRSITDVDQKKREIGCAMIVWLRFLPLMLLVGGLLSWFSPSFINGLPREYFVVTRMTCVLLVVNLLLFPLKSIPESVMVGMNLRYKIIWISAVGTLLSGILLATAAMSGLGLIGLATAFLVGSLLEGCAIFYMARRCLPWLAPRRPERGEVSEFFGFSVWMLAWTLIQRLLLYSDIIIIGFVANASLVGAYTLTFYVAQFSITLSSLLVSAGMPGLGDIVGRGEFKKADEVRAEIMGSSWLLAVVLGTMILLWNRSFVSMWVGVDMFVGPWENFLIVLLMTQMIFIRYQASIVDVTLDIRAKVQWGALSTLVSVALAIIFGAHFESQIAGVMVGLIIGRLILSVLYPMLVRKTLKKGSPITWKGIMDFLRLTGVMGFLYGAAYYLANQIMIDRWYELLVHALLSILVVFCVCFWVGFSIDQRKSMVMRARQLAFK